MRISKINWALRLALITAERSTCIRQKNGCVLLNSHGHVIGTGYNGAAAGLSHCDSEFGHCARGTMEPGANRDKCVAIHAEQNALLQCRNVWEIETVYVTSAPCTVCIKLLLNTSCKRIIFINDSNYPEAPILWKQGGREWIKEEGLLLIT